MSDDPAIGSSGRSRFVLLVMVLLGVGLVLSLWLSTTAAADSYRLDAARSATQMLSERSESLRTEIAAMQSAPALARTAEQMGMVPSADVARLVVMPDGSVQVIGTPKVAVAPPPPVPPATAPAPGGQAVPGQQPTPGQQTVPGQQPTPEQPAAIDQQPVQNPTEAQQQSPADQPAREQRTVADPQAVDQQAQGAAQAPVPEVSPVGNTGAAGGTEQ